MGKIWDDVIQKKKVQDTRVRKGKSSAQTKYREYAAVLQTVKELQQLNKSCHVHDIMGEANI